MKTIPNVAQVLGLGLLATILPLSAPSVRAQTVVNSGFEDPGAPAGGYTDFTSGMTIGSGGWTVGGSDVLLISSTYTETSGALTLSFNAQGGSGNALDISGAGNTGADTISQNIAFQPGQFTLSFYLGRINDDTQSGAKYVGAPSVTASVGGVSLGSFSNNTESLGSVNYQRFDVPFTVSAAGNYALTFTNTTPTGNNYAGLDNITVNVVPEPSTYALVLGSLGLLAIGQRFRRTAAFRA